MTYGSILAKVCYFGYLIITILVCFRRSTSIHFGRRQLRWSISTSERRQTVRTEPSSTWTACGGERDFMSMTSWSSSQRSKGPFRRTNKNHLNLNNMHFSFHGSIELMFSFLNFIDLICVILCSNVYFFAGSVTITTNYIFFLIYSNLH